MSLSVEVNAEHGEAAQKDHILLEVHHVVVLQVLQQHPDAALIQLLLAQSISGVMDGAPWPWHQPQCVGLTNGGNLFQVQSPPLTHKPSPVVGRDGMTQAHNPPHAHATLSLTHSALMLVHCSSPS